MVTGLIALSALGPSTPFHRTPESADAATVPGFTESVAFSGLTNPTVVRFASDGRVFVAEKSGLIKVFDGLGDTTPTTFADLRTNVHNFWDRGLLGLALDPGFPASPYVYVLYAYDHELGSGAPPPRWGSPGATSDGCPNPPGATSDGCVVSGRLSRLQAAGNVMTGAEQVLVEDWCQQFPSHSTGAIEFGSDGALYATGGDGASFTFTDFGQQGNPLNPCGDPPGGVGATLDPPTAQGGALRSQDIRTSGDPASLNGTVIRVDPATGAALPSNPGAGSSDANVRRIIAHGLRNPFRFAIRPGTSELWVGDVGWSDWEEINRISSPTDSTVENFGWPCYEGSPRQPGYDSENLTICETIYSAGNLDTKPFYAYNHPATLAGESCATGSSSIAGLAFESSAPVSSFPAAYQDALYFADYSRDCIWVMKAGGGGVPSPSQIEPFVNGAADPVNLAFGPDGSLYYADFDGGTIRRVSSSGAPPPTCPTGQYQAQYYSNMTVAGSPVLTRCESAVNYDWGTGGPGGGVPTELFSARWTGNFTFAAGATTFTARADDGIRLYVDGTLVINAWVDQGATTYTATRTLTAGTHEVKVEYYENGGDAVAQVSWTGGGADTTPPTVTGRTPAPGATAVAVSVSPTATFSEAMNPSTLNTSTFTLVKQGTSTPVAASISYASQVATLDPSTNLDASAVYTATIKGGATGAKDLAGNALAADVVWSFTTDSGPPPTGCPTGQYQAQYYSNMTLAGSPVLTRCESAVNYDWGTGGPGGGVPTELFSARWTGNFTFAAGATTFTARADDGIRLYVDGTLVINAWVDQGATTYTATRTLTAGTHEVKVEYYENGGDAVAQVSWTGGGADTTPPTVTGRTPAPGATAVAVSVSPTATFSEAMNPSTLNTSTFTLVKQGTSTPVAASISYASQVATLDPSTNLDASAVYTATIKGGATGAKDLAGNALAADVSWTFTTASSGNQPPSPVIDSPTAALTWKVGDDISFAGHASDPEEGTLPASALSWKLLIQHCPSNCHAHTVQTWDGVATGSFDAPDHEHPSYLELQLTATDSGSAATTVSVPLQPSVVALNFGSSPSGLQLTVNGTPSQTPFSRTVIVGSNNSVTATSPQSQGGSSYGFVSWSDGGAQSHIITAPATPATYTATYSTAPPPTCPTGQYQAQYYSNMTVAGSPVLTRCESAVNYDWGTGGPGGGVPTELFSARWTGNFTFAAGATTFTARADDGIRLYVDGTLVINAWVDQGATTYTATRTLTAGTHEVKVEYYENGGDAVAQVSWTGGGADTTPPTVTGRTPAPGATAVAVSVSPTATFSEAMNPSTLNTSTFTLVKQGTSTPVAASISYASQVATLDPSTNLDASAVYTATIKGGATGAKDLAGNALAADVVWSFTTDSGPPPTGCPTGQYQAQYYSNMTLAGSPVLTRCESAPLNNDWAQNAPAAGVPADHFSVRWTGNFTFAAGATTFTARADDGIRLYVDGTLVINAWVDQGATTYTATRTLTAGTHEVKVEYYENGGDAVAQVSWTGGGADTTPPTVTGRTPAPGATAVAVSVSPTATFSEAMNPSTLNTSTFTLVKQGTSTPVAASISYASQVATLDPSTNLDASAVYTATIKGGATGAKDLAGNALAADVVWSFTTDSGPPPTGCPTGQYQAQYYSNMTLAGSPVLTRCESAVNYDWGTGGPGGGVPTELFSARWTGNFTFAAGATTFTARADDGIRLYVDGTLVINAWVDQGATTYTATRTLTAGIHQVKVEYYDNEVDAVAQVSW